MMKVMALIFLITSIEASAKFDWLRSPDASELYTKKRLSIVFASQNLKSPVSMFGHTFLVVHNEMPPEPDAITIEFLGKTSGEFSQYFNALFTQIDGEFRLNKFILKKREYDFEDRNLWIYELSLSEGQNHQIFSSISSTLENRVFPYTFINENCSFYILNAITRDGFESRSIYTLPKYTIRELKKEGYINNSPFLVEADQSKLIRFFKSLNTGEKNKVYQILNGYSYPLTDESWRLRKGLDLALIYKIPREPSPEKRTRYFSIKKQLMDVPLRAKHQHNKFLIKNDPIEVYGDANLRIGYGGKSQSVILEGKIAQRDFYTALNDGLSTSYLEIMKGKISFNKKENIRVQQFTIFKLESLIPEGDYNEPFNRLIDLSFYNHHYKKNRSAKESVLRYGSGLSLKWDDLALGVIPYLGLRYFNFNFSNGFEADLGVLTKLNYWLSDSISLEGTLTNIFLSNMPLDHKISIKLASRLNKRFAIGLESTIYDQNDEVEFSLIYGF